MKDTRFSRRTPLALSILLSLFSALLIPVPLGAEAGAALLRFKLFPPDASVEIDGGPAALTPGPEETRQTVLPPGLTRSSSPGRDTGTRFCTPAARRG